MTLEYEKWSEMERVRAERNLQLKFESLRAEKTLRDEHTLEFAFKLMNVWLGNYRLTSVEKLVDEILPITEEKDDEWHTKAIQMKAFVCFKLRKFQDSLDNFHKMKTRVGPSAALAENMAHAYNSLGQYENAEKYFEESLFLLNCPTHKNPNVAGNPSGVNLGLGIVKKRLGRPRDGISNVLVALRMYQEEYSDGKSSLIAKAMTSLGRCLNDMKEYDHGTRVLEGALSLFAETCGECNPLTVDCMGHLADLRLVIKDYDYFNRLLSRSLSLEMQLDTVREDQILETISKLFNIYAFHVPLLPPKHVTQCKRALSLVHDQWKERKILRTGQAAVIFMTAGKLAVYCGFCDLAVKHLMEALMLMGSLNVPTEPLEKDCTNWMEWALTNLKKKENASKKQIE